MAEKATILVGVDGSKESFEALQWGASRAKQTGAKLQILCAYALPSYTSASLESGYSVVDQDSIKESAQSVVREAAKRIKDFGVELELLVVAGDSTAVLVSMSKKVDLIVIGTRGGGGFADRLLGATSSALPAYARCPVVVVPRCPEESSFLPVERVVVGVDGSKASLVSLTAAAKETKLWDAELTAIQAVPIIGGGSMLAWIPATIDRDTIFNEVRQDLRELCAQVEQETEVAIRSHALDGNASSLLIEFSTAVDLVVVGSRGRGNLAGVLLGSTSQSVLSHCACPVMVVPSGEVTQADQVAWDRPVK